MTAYILSNDNSKIIGTGQSGNWQDLPDDDARVTAWQTLTAWKNYQMRAIGVLADADTTMLRISEAVSLGLNSWTGTDVVAWVDYRRALRAIVSASSGDPSQPLPAKPAYPAGT